MSLSPRIGGGLVALLTSVLFIAGAAGCGIVSCGEPPPERIAEYLARAHIVLTADAELVGVGYGCWQDDSIYFTIAVPPESVDGLLRASRVDPPLEPMEFPAHVGDGRGFSTVEPGPRVFEARAHDVVDYVVDYSHPDRVMVYINYLGG